MVVGNSGDEGHKGGAAEELGDEDGSVGLGLSTVDPLEAWPENA